MLLHRSNSHACCRLFLATQRGLAHYQSQAQKADAASIIISDCNNPYVNLAMEQHLFKSAPLKHSHTLMIWRNHPTVVIGRNQNPWAECDLKAMEENHVNLVRRSSGGGTVYQDLGNTNFTFVAKEKDMELGVNFRTVLQALQTLGIDAICSGRNDIEVDGRKISGSAFKHASGHSMHHGTLLASVNMGVMSSVLTPNSLKLQSKGVASVAARVVNLAELNPLVDHQALTSALIHSFQQNFFCSSSAITCLDQSAMMSISEVAIEAQKLQEREWMYGQTPKFTQEHKKRFDWGTVTIQLDCHGDVISSGFMYTDSLVVEVAPIVNAALKGCKYSVNGLRENFAIAAESTTNAARPQVQDVRAWLEGALENV